ncbi:MAG: hypothetical protein IPJ71_02030 [Bdellovibrionales bacterium]|nr:hypothetical protein [Bdellovibrionales bacterium]
MNQFLKNNRKLVIVGIVAVVVLGYFAFKSNLVGSQSEQRAGKVARETLVQRVTIAELPNQFAPPS